MQAGVGVVEGLGMTRRNSWLSHEVGGNVFGQEAIAWRDGAAPINAVGLVGQVDGERFRLFLTPDQRAFGAGDFDAEVVFVADGNLGGSDQGLAAVAQFAIDREVIIQRAAWTWWKFP